jgi:hypothetical protein
MSLKKHQPPFFPYPTPYPPVPRCARPRRRQRPSRCACGNVRHAQQKKSTATSVTLKKKSPKATSVTLNCLTIKTPSACAKRRTKRRAASAGVGRKGGWVFLKTRRTSTTRQHPRWIHPLPTHPLLPSDPAVVSKRARTPREPKRDLAAR